MIEAVQDTFAYNFFVLYYSASLFLSIKTQLHFFIRFYYTAKKTNCVFNNMYYFQISIIITLTSKYLNFKYFLNK